MKKKQIQKMENEKLQKEGLQAIHSLNFCGCGDPSDAYSALLETLKVHNAPENQTLEERITIRENWNKKLDIYNYLILYFIDAAGLTEHGGSVGGCWLTQKGQAVVAFLEEWGTEPDEWPELEDFK